MSMKIIKNVKNTEYMWIHFKEKPVLIKDTCTCIQNFRLQKRAKVFKVFVTVETLNLHKHALPVNWVLLKNVVLQIDEQVCNISYNLPETTKMPDNHHSAFLWFYFKRL